MDFRARGRSNRRRRPTLETLEGRLAPALDFTATLTLGASGSLADVKVNGTAIDSAGNLFVTGSFRGSVGFDPANPTATTASVGSRDAFVASYSSSGGLRWSSVLAGADGSAVGQGTAIGIDSGGNVYVTGSFSGMVDFDPGNASTLLSSPSRTDIFILKLNAGGGLIWARDVAGTLNSVNQGDALTVEANRGVLVGGVVTGAATFGSQAVAVVGLSEAFVTRVDPLGNFVWTTVTSGGNGSTAEIHGIAANPDGSAVAVGFFKGAVDFDPNGPSPALSPAGYRDASIWALDSNGGTKWAKSVGGPDLDQANAVAIDGSGTIDVVGQFSFTADFGTAGVPRRLTASGDQDPFLLRLSPAGVDLAAFDFGETTGNSGAATGATIDPAGNTVVTGWFNGSLDADPTSSISMLAAGGGSDVFLSAIGPNGGFLTAASGGGAAFDAPFGIAANSNGDLILAGTSSAGASFGSTTISSIGTSQVFISRLRDTIPPPVTGAPSLNAASDTGASATDRVTFSRSPTFDVTGVLGGFPIRLYRDGIRVATGTNIGTIVDPGPVPDGIHAYTSTQVSPAGIESVPSPSTLVTVDATPPAAPTGLAIVLADDTGTPGDGTTSNSRPRIQGLAEPGSAVDLSTANGTVLGSTVAGPDGRFLVTPTLSLPEGSLTLQVRATDLAGNAGPFSVGYVVTILTTPPSALAAPTLLATDDTGVANDKLTSVGRPRFTGLAPAGSVVQLLDAIGTILGQATSDGLGRYSVQPSNSIVDGPFDARVRAVDVAGNIGPAGPSLRITIDTTPPNPPTGLNLSTSDDSGIIGDGITALARPRLIGGAEPGSSITIRDSQGSIIARATTDAQGAFVAQPITALAEGSTKLVAVAADLAGNTSAASAVLTITIDATPPNPPTGLDLSALDDSGVLGDRLTNEPRPRFTGRTEPGAGVRLIDESGAVAASGFADSGGLFSLRLDLPLTDGPHAFRANATDAAGNVGASASPVTITIDTTAPAAPSPPDLSTLDDSGVIGDRLTNVAAPLLVGTAEPGSWIQIRDPARTVIAQGQADPTGRYAFRVTTALPPGPNVLTVAATDAAGNTGPSSSSTVTVDVSPPAPPTGVRLSPGDDSGTLGDGLTNAPRPRLIGNAEPLSTVLFKDGGGNLVASGQTNASGFFIAPFLNDALDGTYGLSPIVMDAAGNSSLLGATLTLRVDRTPPAAPSLPNLTAVDDTGILGDGLTRIAKPRFDATAEPLASVDLLDEANRTVGGGRADADGKVLISTFQNLDDGSRSLRLRATDAAGNTSVASPSLTITVDTTPPAIPDAPRLSDADDSGLKGDARTKVKTPAIVGSTEAFAAVRLIDGAGGLVASGTADAAGAYRLVPTTPMNEGPVVLRVLATDAAGNESLPGTGLSLTIHSTTPPPPGLSGLLPADDTGTMGDLLTSNARPRLTGTSQPGTLINVSGIGATATVGLDGSFTILPTAPLAEGVYSITVTATDSDGNVSRPSTSLTFTIRMTPPIGVALSLAPSDDTGVVGDATTTRARPSMIGATSPGALVTLVDATGRVWSQATADASGMARLTPTAELPLGATIFAARARDVAGNQGTLGASLTVRRIQVWGDFDGTGAAELGILASATAGFLVAPPGSPGRTTVLGKPKLDLAIPADFDGDGRTDLAVYRAKTAEWVIRRSSDQAVVTRVFGKPNGDIPVPGDYDGDGIADLAVYRPSTGQWLIQLSTTGATRTVSLGKANVDLPVPADYDGDGRIDLATYRPSAGTWTILNSTNGSTRSVSLGKANVDVPVPADYDGDGKADPAVYRSSTALWQVLSSSTSQVSTFVLGKPNASIPVPADYMGIGRAQAATYRASASEFVLGSSNGGDPRRVTLGKTGGSALLRAPAARLKWPKPALGPP